MDRKNFTWTQVSAGRYQRDVDEAERFYTSLALKYKATGRTFFAITGHVSVSLDCPTGDDDERLETAFRKAWIRLRFAHPAIASWVEQVRGEQKFVKVYETGGVERWANETLVNVETDLSGLEWCNSDPPVPKLATIFLIKTRGEEPGKKTVVLRSHHDIVDGIGTLLLLNHFMALVGEEFDNPSGTKLQELGSEVGNLSPPLRVAASLPDELIPEQKTRLEEIRQRNAKLREGVDVSTIPTKGDVKIPGRHQRAELWLSIEQTTKVLQACKNRGISVTHAYHAAIALAMRDVQQHKDATERTLRYVTYCLMNERKACAERWRDAVSVYHSVSGESLGVDLSIPPRENEFAEVVENFRVYYESIRDDIDRLPLIMEYWAAGTPSLDGDGSVPPPNTMPSVSISSMGLLDNIVAATQGKRVKVDDPWVTGEELGNGVGAFLSTWKGRLCISAAYNDAFQGKEDVDKFLREVQRVVEEGLDITSR